jgi:hypothetical protein
MAPQLYKTSVSISAAKEMDSHVRVPRSLLLTSPLGEFIHNVKDVPSAGISGRNRVAISRASRAFFHDRILDGKEGDGGREGKE